MKVSHRYSCIFLFLVVLIIYYPSINSVVNSVDDTHIIREYGSNGHRTLQEILLPGGQFYFRPVIELTYYLDNLLWGLDPSFMHLENVLLHAVNVVLVYLVASALSPLLPGLPFISALLFAVHPINTEAVSWIAGRTDPLAALFILVSTLFLLKACKNGSYKYLFVAFSTMLLSFLVKETAIMMLPLSVLIAYSEKSGRCAETEGGESVRKWLPLPYLGLVCASLVYVTFRYYLKPDGTVNAFSMLFHKSFEPAALVRDFFVTSGFYFKKLFVPLPLNFAIDTVTAWYILPGIITVLLCIYMLKNLNYINSFFIAVFLFIIPAVIVKFTGITWTPFAERYMYIPSAFFSIWLSANIIHLTSYTKIKQVIYLLLVVVVCIAAVFSFRRNLIWRDNFSLYQDTVNKSPEFGDIHNELGTALLGKGEYAAARKHFLLAQQLSRRPLIREFAELNLLNCDMAGKKSYVQKDIIRNYVASKETVQPGLLLILRTLSHQILMTEKDPDKKRLLMREIIVLNDRLFREAKDPHCLYSNGQLMLALGDKSSALAYFRRVLISAPPDVYYFEPAKKLVRQLEK